MLTATNYNNLCKCETSTTSRCTSLSPNTVRTSKTVIDINSWSRSWYSKLLEVHDGECGWVEDEVVGDGREGGHLLVRASGGVREHEGRHEVTTFARILDEAGVFWGLCPDYHYGKIHFLEQNRQAVDDDDHYTLTDLQFAIPRFNCFQVVGSCHGLLCLATNSSLRNLIYVCNPFTRQYVRLPDPPIRPLHHNPHSMVVGFGFCDKTHEYKVVEVAPSKLFPGVQTEHSMVFVFTLGECRRDKGDVPCAVETLAGVSNKFVNGALHWVGSSPVNVILSFDVGDEVFGVIPFPDQIFGRDQRGFCSLKILGGCLLIVNCSLFGNPAEIWVMLDYGVKESWTKCFTWKDSEAGLSMARALMMAVKLLEVIQEVIESIKESI
ncbi:hypothetical protein RHMOL_Rhmol04G0068600 [Rhododendron molle]|uniref:Uncharacterized protein n=1 Tax=Rhododendron molle TaxID=49168 RepID=A0ACC0NXR1_RHOML|nr:hypothetical protein RHMOL_Rhmol04G0068600 [Rhododendron molle]